MEIRAANDADLPALVAVLGQRRFFSEQLARQRAGAGVLLVAWVDGRPVGDVFLDRDPASDPSVRRHLPGVPTLVHLEVLGPYQRRGIGTALIRAGEDTARRLGHQRLAMGVGLDNHGARRLYERLGYIDWGHGTTVASWQEHDPTGTPMTVSETIAMLVRRLSPGGDRPMEPPVIRPARPGDAADLARNWVDGARHYAELDPDAFQVPGSDGLAGWFEELLRPPRPEEAIWLVAELHGQVVGDVSAHLERPAADAERQLLRDLGRARLYVDALGVLAEYRRLGVGTRLLRAAEEWGRERGAVRSVLTTYHASPLSVPFYEQGVGYERRSIVFEKRLDQ